jgi:DNA-binding protein YbaB
MEQIRDSIKDLQKEVKSLREEVSTGKGIVRVLVVLGSLAAAFIGYLNLK